MNIVQLTKEGHEKLKQEYDELVAKKRPEAVDRLQKARSMGDLSENSEYSAAKDNLAFVEGRVQEIEELLKNVEVIKNHNHGSEVCLGATVTANLNGNRDIFQIVGEFEADPMKKQLSHNSPIGKALLGKKIGDHIEIEIPAGKIQCTIIDIK